MNTVNAALDELLAGAPGGMPEDSTVSVRVVHKYFAALPPHQSLNPVS